MDYVIPERKGMGGSNEFFVRPKTSRDDRRQLLAEKIIQHDEDLAKIKRDNEGKDPLWPEDQYERRR